MIPIRLGIELELIGPDSCFMQEFFKRRLKINLKDWSRKNVWAYMEDASCYDGDAVGMEIATPAFRSMRELRSLEKVLDAVGRFCWVNRSCGMHVHISTPGRYELDERGFADAVWSRYGKDVRHGRKQYCRPGVGDSEDDRWRAVSVVDGNHVEVRVFNGTLDYRVVQDRCEEVIKLYRSFLFPSGRSFRRAKIGRVVKKS